MAFKLSFTFYSYVGHGTNLRELDTVRFTVGSKINTPYR